MPFNIVNSLNIVSDSINAGNDAVDKVEAIDHINTALAATLAAMNNMIVAMGGLFPGTSITSAFAQMALLLGGGPGANVVGGTYTPIAAAVANVTAFANVFDAQYMRIRNQVFVAGVMRVTPTVAAATFTTWTLSLPFASDLTGTIQLAGTLNADPSQITPQGVIGDGVNPGHAGFSGLAVNNTSALITYSYGYTIVP